MKITKDNVKDLWELYEIYKQNYKRHCITFKENLQMENFETFVDNEVFQCNNCENYFIKDEMGDSELALQDNICQECMENGYGR